MQPIIYLAINILHFENFAASKHIEITDQVKKYLQDFIKHRSERLTVQTRELENLFDNYDDYKLKNTSRRTWKNSTILHDVCSSY